MFAWATEKLEVLSQTVAPPPTDAPGRYQYAVQRLDEDTAMGCIAEFEPLYTVVNHTKDSYPIHLACQYSLVRLVRQLMNQPGASIEQADRNGDTPLHYACMSTQSNALDVVKILLMDYGADVCAKNAQGQYPYDVATLNSVRQHLLPIQLQKETQACLDNGGQGLPPGIDLGGLKIQNSAMPPPPTFANGAGAGGPPGGPASFSMSASGSTSLYAPPPMPNMAPQISTTSVPPAPQSFPSAAVASAPAAASIPSVPAALPAPRSYGGSRSTSATAKSTERLATDPTTGYSRTGGSSLAVYSKYKADGFHSSSSDVNLQKKYGHVGAGGPSAVPPPPSSGNSLTTPPPSGGVPATPSPFMTGGANPFSRSSSALSNASSTGGSRYVAYGPAAAPAAPPGSSYGQMMSPTVVNAPAPQYFTPAVSSPAAAAPTAAVTGATATTTTNSSETMKSAADLFQTPQPVQQPSATSPQEEPLNTATSTESATTIGDWVETTDPTSGKIYYYNPTTNETSWEKPESEKQTRSEVSTDDEDEWQEIHDPSTGKPYYFNSKTNETRWEKPESIVDDLKDSDNVSEEGDSVDGEPDQEPSDDGGATISEGSSVVETDTIDDIDDISRGSNGDQDVSSVESAPDSAEEDEPSVEEVEEEDDDDDNDGVNENSSDGDDLPDGWVETEDPSSGRIYFYNSLTQETSWDRPVAVNDIGNSELEPVDDDEDSNSGEEAQETEAIVAGAEDDPLGDGWTEVTDPNTGNIYYYNQLTHETSWEKPSPAQSTDSTGGWSEVVDPSSGRTYYYNAVTNETSWTKPNKFEIATANKQFQSHEMSPEQTTSAGVDTNAITKEEIMTQPAKALSSFPVPVATRSAEDLFSTAPPGEDISAVDDTTSIDPVSTTGPVLCEKDTTSSTDGKEVTTTSAPSLEEPQNSIPSSSAPADVAAVQDEPDDKKEPQEVEEVMEEVPLSPDVVTKTVAPNITSNDLQKTEPLLPVESEATSDPKNDLFAAIGMPPPPVRKR